MKKPGISMEFRNISSNRLNTYNNKHFVFEKRYFTFSCNLDREKSKWHFVDTNEKKTHRFITLSTGSRCNCWLDHNNPNNNNNS